jgi:hypothetical protein
MRTEAEVKAKLEEKKREGSKEASYWTQALNWVLEDSEKPKMRPYQNLQLPGRYQRVPFPYGRSSKRR